ncbi:hypothetical protein CIPAW_06G053200 [Carya illinoinensis]|uniref:Reverse transcriptase zinc-binding domain-containing protein n=1 Tax=Carya illinoinensis TaxID=32201 RepID=A0A8T1Q872_CARIL|nr:hypothetical protein CIPAW_06G053200 [Carya illinoinensis]
MQNLFDQLSIREIQKIPLPIAARGIDKEIWALNHSGKYSIKIAYHAQVDYHEQALLHQSSLFKPLWSLKIHDRHKLLLWKLLWNILPTKEKINERISQQINSECTFCNQGEETVLHLFVECPIVRILWKQGCWPLNIERLPILSISDWIEMIIHPGKFLGLQEQDCRRFQLYAVILLDLLWKKRNDIVHNHSTFSLEDAKKQLYTSYESYKNAWAERNSTKSSSQVWTPPLVGFQSISFDAAVRDYFSVTSAVRDHSGKILEICPEKIHSSVPLVAEAKAALLVVCMAGSSRNMSIEGDAQSVFSALERKDSTPFWSISPIIEDIQVHAKDRQDWIFTKIHRS